jgi:hypothetical protein
MLDFTKRSMLFSAVESIIVAVIRVYMWDAVTSERISFYFDELRHVSFVAGGSAPYKKDITQAGGNMFVLVR